MTQVFDEEGSAIPVTVLELLPMTVTQVKTKEKDGYTAVQVGYQDAKAKHLSKAEQGHLKGKGLFRHLKEFRLDASALEAFKEGEQLALFEDGSFLSAGTLLKVTGKSIGKGFQGGTKRWGFARGPMTHGSKSHRLPGSIGGGTTPGRVLKGTKMAGQMGNKQVTAKNLKVVRVIPDKNVVLIQGSVPGVENGLLTLRPVNKGPVNPAVAAG
ncbi:MAG: 50S ribosomal protein L3 [Vampirovibrio sp.]|nr:50S ribosomal protein L3 [Vampirovibrio sp.]